MNGALFCTILHQVKPVVQLPEEPETELTSSPTTSADQPGTVGLNMAKSVFPQALGNAAAMYLFLPAGFVIPRI